MTSIKKNAHEFHIKAPLELRPIVFRATQIAGYKTVSAFMRSIIIKECQKILNGTHLLETATQDLDTLESLEKEQKPNCPA